MKGITDIMARQGRTDDPCVQLESGNAAIAISVMAIDSRRTVCTEPLIAANNTSNDAITISTVG